ncbi:MAG: siroheme synthase, partial [Clostridium sp.]|nr:siroheme synthase [Clostridium sp.]
SCLLVIYHSCVNGAFEALLEAITEEDTKMYAVHEKQSSVCPLPFQDTSVAVLPLYMLRGIHFQKDSEENSDLILRLQKQQCRVEVVTKACIELEPFQKLMIEKMME